MAKIVVETLVESEKDEPGIQSARLLTRGTSVPWQMFTIAQ